MDQLPVSKDSPPASRWQLIRDLVAFQFKLVLDSLRDVLLSPISIIAAVVGLLTNSRDPGKYFYRLMALGHRSDHWINLFKVYDTHQVDEEDKPPSADSFVRHAENIVLKEYEKGGVVSNLKNSTDKVFDSFTKNKLPKDDLSKNDVSKD